MARLPDRLVILPPMAIARVGSGLEPLEAFSWGENEFGPDGSGKTSIRPEPSLRFGDDHALSAYLPSAIRFKDEGGFRPVCPFFELHGVWSEGGAEHTAPIDTAMVPPGQVTWQVDVANLKASNLTGDAGCAISASLAVRADAAGWHALEGRCPQGVPTPLLPPGRAIPLGRIRIPLPGDAFPEFRLRFYPAAGVLYGPVGLGARWDAGIPEARLILDPASSWCRWEEDADDLHATPQGQYAADARGRSFGVLDDVCDGFVSCSVAGMTARARIIVAPPDFAPDRRPLTSIADGLKDREDRADVRDPAFLQDAAQCEREAIDMLERAFETVGLMNMDVIADHFALLNGNIAQARDIDYDPQVFFAGAGGGDASLPLSARARRFHRRLAVPEILRDLLRRNAEFVQHGIRNPASRNTFYSREMPALMRGADGGPLHLTQRQYELLRHYAAGLAGPETTT